MSSIERAIERLGELVNSSVLAPEAATVGAPPASPPRPAQEVKKRTVAQPRTLRNGRIKLHFAADERRLHLTVDPSSLDANLTDEYRRIKRPLLANAFGTASKLVRDGNLIAVTSSVPGEGKSFTSLNLALSIAMERDHGVLLIDCDTSKASLSKAAGLDAQAGLVDVLVNSDLDLGQVLVPTDVPNFAFLPAGQRHPHATELLTSSRMRGLIEEMATRYDNRVIIFDSPPVLATPEAQIICSAVGQVVFVVAAAKTTRSTVEQALELVSERGEKPVGLVLNKSVSLPGLRQSTGSYGYYG